MDIATLQNITDNFVRALENSSQGNPSSLIHIKNTIPKSPLIKEDETFQAMAIGGTNYKSALVKKTSTGVEMVTLDQKAQPPVFETKEDFLKFVKENLADNIDVLAINFAFPLEPVFANNKLEGILLYASKEHKFEGLIGKNVSTEVENYIKDNLGRDIKVSVANDTICLLLSGKTQIQGDNIAAGIVGTGLNFAYFADHTTLINTETGGFFDFPHSSELREIDSESAKQGEYLFEKAIAGAYLYKHFNIMAREKNIFIPPLTNSMQLTEIAERDDASQISILAQEILRKSAQLAATAIAGITKYKKEDTFFVMVGSLFWKGDGYKHIVRETVKQLVPEYQVEFLGIENSDLLGAAKLVA